MSALNHIASANSNSQPLGDTPIPKCPGLFYRTPSRDGNIIRIRIPGGVISTLQISTVLQLARNFGDGNIYLTNRGNLQIRGVAELPSTALISLQRAGLAATIPEIDHIRNIMASPTAGIDCDELVDTLPLVRELDEYICSHPELNRLSAKFSVGFDGGGRVAISQQPNDIKFVAVQDLSGEIYLQLLLEEPTNIFVQPEECLPVIVALIKVYLAQLDGNLTSKPRFLEIVRNYGQEKFLELVNAELGLFCQRESIQVKEYNNYDDHIGIHQQKQQDSSYIGIAIPLGTILIEQLEKISQLADIYGSQTLRLTPWQNILIPDIKTQDVLKVESEIINSGLQTSANSPQSGIVACTGNQGCKAGLTDTKAMANTLIEYLTTHISLDLPCKIHLTSCAKSCAHHGKSDITLLGTVIGKDGYITEGYDLYVGDLDTNFGRKIYRNIPSTNIVEVILKMLQTYQIKRQNVKQTFGSFVNSYEINRLQKLFEISHLLEFVSQEVNCQC